MLYTGDPKTSRRRSPLPEIKSSQYGHFTNTKYNCNPTTAAHKQNEASRCINKKKPSGKMKMKKKTKIFTQQNALKAPFLQFLITRGRVKQGNLYKNIKDLHLLQL